MRPPVASLKVPFSLATTPRTIKYALENPGLLSLPSRYLFRSRLCRWTRLRDPNHLRALYQDVELKAHDLSDQNAEGITYQEIENRFVIVLDPKWNTSEDEALRTMRHEACHVATWDVMDPNDVHGDVHGPPFQECMKRFEKK